MKQKIVTFLAVLALAISGCAVLSRVLNPPVRLNLAAVELWTAAGTVADLSVSGPEVWMASTGGLLRLAEGEAVERRCQPEIAWRGVAARDGDVAAVGLRNLVCSHAGVWHSAVLPEQAEGYSIAATSDGWWVGHSLGYQRLDPETGLAELRRVGPIRKVVAGANDAWALGQDRFYPIKGEAMASPAGVKGPWAAVAAGGALLLAGTDSDRPLTLWRWSDHWRALPAIPASGSHVTALADAGGLVAAVAGDGWWRLQHGRWQRLAVGIPPPLAQDTAALASDSSAWLGAARSGGVWRYSAGAWSPVNLPEELPAANLQALAQYRGQLYASTFDRGLLVRTGSRWQELGQGSSPDYPRQMAVSEDRLYVRETDGALSVWDGLQWRRNILRHQLRRAWIGTLVADADGLTLGGWGTVVRGTPGQWRETALSTPWDSMAITSLAWNGNKLAAGTGSQGLLLVDPETGRAGPARGGPSDPWISALSGNGSGLLAGTAGGQLGWVERDEPVANLVAGVTALATLPDGTAIAATRDGLYRQETQKWQRLPCPLADALEPQCLLTTEDALWVGGRYGLLRIPFQQRASRW